MHKPSTSLTLSERIFEHVAQHPVAYKRVSNVLFITGTVATGLAIANDEFNPYLMSGGVLSYFSSLGMYTIAHLGSSK